ncbi:unnamed protein product [Sympodiomycopsis kandeliae]
MSDHDGPIQLIQPQDLVERLERDAACFSGATEGDISWQSSQASSSGSKIQEVGIPASSLLGFHAAHGSRRSTASAAPQANTDRAQLVRNGEATTAGEDVKLCSSAQARGAISNQDSDGEPNSEQSVQYGSVTRPRKRQEESRADTSVAPGQLSSKILDPSIFDAMSLCHDSNSPTFHDRRNVAPLPGRQVFEDLRPRILDALGNNSKSSLSPSLKNSDSTRRPLVIFDLRPLHSFLQFRIVGSINLALPSLVLRRMKRASADGADILSNASIESMQSAPSHQASSPLVHLMTYVTTSSGKRKLQSFLESLSSRTPAPPASDDHNKKVGSIINGDRVASPLDLWQADVITICHESDRPLSLPKDLSDSALTRSTLPFKHPDERNATRSPQQRSLSYDAARTFCMSISRLGPSSRSTAGLGVQRGSASLLECDIPLLNTLAGWSRWIEQGPESQEMLDTDPRHNYLENSQYRTAITTPRTPSLANDIATGSSTLDSASTPKSPQSLIDQIPETALSIATTAPSKTPSPHSKSPSAANGPVTDPVVTGPASMAPPPKRPGRPSLARLDTSERIKTIAGPAPQAESRQPSANGSGPLRINVTGTQSPRRAAEPGLSPACTRGSALSVQSVAHLQSRFPPSPATFSEMSLPVSSTSPALRKGDDRLQLPWSQAQADRELARRGSGPVEGATVDSSSASLSEVPSGGMSSGSGAFEFSPNLDFAQASSQPPSFDVSTIIPSFLYLGPDITSEEEFAELEGKGVRRILNCAAELTDRGNQSGGAAPSGGASILPLGSRLEKYLKIPMWDNVEATGVQADFEQACAFLDDARLHDSPVYVHCRAGKSRSVSIVIAYLIHAHRWSLRESYDYVARKRPDISPNIGFVSCLMAFEEMILNRRALALERNEQAGSTDVELQRSAAAAPQSPAHNHDFAPSKQSRQSMPSINSLFTPRMTGHEVAHHHNQDASDASMRFVHRLHPDGSERLLKPTTNVADRNGRSSPPQHALPSGSTTQFITEHRGRDGRYRAQRGPAVDLEASNNETRASVQSSCQDDSSDTSDNCTNRSIVAREGEDKSGARTGSGVANAYAPCRRATMAGLGSLQKRDVNPEEPQGER